MRKLGTQEEAEANLFAMALLMPETFVRAEVRKMGGFDLSDDRALKTLATKFQVPQTLMAIRLAQLWPKLFGC